MRLGVAPVLLLAAALLGGCAGDAPAALPPAGKVDATPTTGGIRGVVVDEAIRPIAGVNVTAVGDELTKGAVTDAQGLYVIDGLAEGIYIVKASHPYYGQVQKSVEVLAGVELPDATDFQMTRVIEGRPYFDTLVYDGFIACSVTLGGGSYSEECGEGAGVPCDVPVIGCERLGGQEGNNIQYDFTVEGPHVKALVVEQVWDSTTSVAGSGSLMTLVATDWLCDPSCSGKEMGDADGPSPLHIFVGPDVLEGRNLTPETAISAFTTAGGEEASVTLNQKYTLLVTPFYFAAPPEDWSFVAGDPDPFPK